MVRREKTKTAILVLTSICLIISVLTSTLDGFPIEKFAIAPHCTILARFAYPFFHASVIHCAVNAWCLLSVVFIYDVTPANIIIAYIAAVLFPIDTLAATVPHASAWGSPTVGLSAVVFALLGMVSFQAKKRLLFHAWMLSFIIIGFIIPPVCQLCGLNVAAPNNILHIYSYVVGLMVGFLNSPAHANS